MFMWVRLIQRGSSGRRPAIPGSGGIWIGEIGGQRSALEAIRQTTGLTAADGSRLIIIPFKKKRTKTRRRSGTVPEPRSSPMEVADGGTGADTEQDREPRTCPVGIFRLVYCIPRPRG